MAQKNGSLNPLSIGFRICLPKGDRGCLRSSYWRPKSTIFSRFVATQLRCPKPKTISVRELNQPGLLVYESRLIQFQASLTKNKKVRLEICQKIYTTEFLGQKIYTLKVRKLRLFLLKNKQRKSISISYFSRFVVKIQLSV